MARRCAVRASTGSRVEAVDYSTIKLIHQGAVSLSFAGFVARGLGAIADASWIRSRWAKTVPHVVDSVLLISALSLVWMLRINPGVTPWLLAKIVGLFVYIGLGVVALRPGSARPLRAAAWMGALTVFAYIVSVAITKNPLGLVSLL
jgi:uncharacterized membrane protein SirB2